MLNVLYLPVLRYYTYTGIIILLNILIIILVLYNMTSHNIIPIGETRLSSSN